MRKIYLSLLVSMIVSTFIYAQKDVDVFISEYTCNGYGNAIEIFNPTADTIDLTQYSIVRNRTHSFTFPSGKLYPFEMWVGCRNDGDGKSIPPEYLAKVDSSWSASGSIWFFSDVALIELRRNDTVIDAINSTPSNATVAGIPSALTNHTLIRKPEITNGEVNWDISRGTYPEDSEWIVYNAFYDNLRKHDIDLINPTYDTSTNVSSERYQISGDTIYLDSECSVDTIVEYLGFPENGSYVFENQIGNPFGEGTVKSGDRVKVFSQIGTSTTYPFHVLADQDTLMNVESMVYYFQNNNMVNVAEGTPVDVVLNSLYLWPEGVTAEIVDNAMNPKTGTVTNGDKLLLRDRRGLAGKNFTIYTHIPVEPAGLQIHTQAKLRKLPFGAPRYSDVNFTSRWARTPGLFGGPEAIPAAKSFHGTNFRWVYITTRPSSNYPQTNDWVKYDVKGNGFTIGASLHPGIQDLPYGQGWALDSRAEMPDGTEVSIFCPNKPGGRQAFMNHVQAAIEMGSDFSIQMDDPHHRGAGEDVCYCEYCRKKAKEWNMTVGSDAFFSKSVEEFWKWVQAETKNITGKQIAYSCNNTSNHVFDGITKQFDFMIGECDPRWGYGADKYFSDERFSAEPMGKIQVFNLSVKGIVIEDPTLVWRNRSIIGLAYGIGGNCIVPWDTWMHPPIEERRYFGLPSEYADLFGFIRANSRFLDNYETAFDFMPGYNDTRFTDTKPLYVSDNDSIFAYVRAIPDNPSEPIVVHLVDWKETPEKESMKIHILPEYFFSGNTFGIYLVEPAKYNQKVHETVIENADKYLKPGTFRGSEHEALYGTLRNIKKLDFVRSGNELIVDIDSIPTYAMLVLVPESNPALLKSEYYSITASGISGYSNSDYVCEFLSRIERNPLNSFMVVDDNGDAVYNTIPENSKLILLSPDKIRLVEYSINPGLDQEIEISQNQINIGQGESFGFDPVSFGVEGEPVTFSVKNTSGETCFIDTIVCDNSSFVCNYSFNSIPSGGNAEFIITFLPQAIGELNGKLSIINSDKSLLPFSFSLNAQSLTSNMIVKYKDEILNPGTGVLFFGEVKLEKDSVVVLDILNSGTDTLRISEIVSRNTDILSANDFDAKIAPNGAGTIQLKFAPKYSVFDIIEFSILSNNPGLSEFDLYAQGTGLMLNPSIEVSYNQTIFDNNVGIVDFGTVILDSVKIEKIIVSNTGVDNLYITDIESSLPAFSLLSQPDTIKPGESDTIMISFIPLMNLKYSASISINSNDQNVSKFNILIKGAGFDYVGVPQQSENSFFIYPNPFRDHLFINNLEGQTTIKINDVSGSLVKIVKVNSFENVKIETTNIKPGLYIVNITNRETSHSFKFIKPNN